jgi:hypothetical protein
MLTSLETQVAVPPKTGRIQQARKLTDHLLRIHGRGVGKPPSRPAARICHFHGNRLRGEISNDTPSSTSHSRPQWCFFDEDSLSHPDTKSNSRARNGSIFPSKLHLLSRHLRISIHSVPGALMVLVGAIERRPISILLRCPRLGGADGTVCWVQAPGRRLREIPFRKENGFQTFQSRLTRSTSLPS